MGKGMMSAHDADGACVCHIVKGVPLGSWLTRGRSFSEIRTMGAFHNFIVTNVEYFLY